MPAPLRALLDGRVGDCVSVADRGLQYGDGLFETIRVSRGRPCLWAEHLARLELGATRLGLPLPDVGELYREVLELAACGGEAVVKLIVTRGDGGRGYRRPERPQSRRLVALYPLPSYPDDWQSEGVSVIQCRTPVSENARLAGLKHLNRLDQVLARTEWDDPQIAEGLMCDAAGSLIGGTSTNLFLIRGTELATPRLDRAGITGTVRTVVGRLAPTLGFSVTETELRPEDLIDADAAFLTNAVVGLWPIRAWVGRIGRYRRPPEDLVAAIREASMMPEGVEE